MAAELENMMTRIDRSGLKGFSKSLLTVSASAVLVVSVLTAPLSAQNSPKVQGYPTDWSHHHVVFSNPGTDEKAVQNGTVDKWLKITNHPRYTIQQHRQSRASAPSALSNISFPPTFPTPDNPRGGHKDAKIEKDWSVTLSGAAASLTGTVGALSGGISGSSTLTVDSG